MKNIYEGFNAYKLYLAVKNHFTTSYDFFKYNGKVNAKEDSFLKRKDKFFFAKLQRKYKDNDLRDLFVSNFADGEDFWIGNVLTQKLNLFIMNGKLDRLSSLISLNKT